MGETKAWRITLDGDEANIEEIEPEPGSCRYFIRITCEGVVGIKKNAGHWSLLNSIEDPDVEPWYLIRVYGCWPDKFVYKDGVAYWVQSEPIDPPIPGTHVPHVTDKKVEFDRDQVEEAIEAWAST